MLRSAAVISLLIGCSLFILVHGQGKRERSLNAACLLECIAFVARARSQMLCVLLLLVFVNLYVAECIYVAAGTSF